MAEMVTLREIRLVDAAAAARLSAELGYPADVAEMERRILGLNSAGQSVIVACVNEDVVAWINMAATQHLQSGPYAEIGGLVVTAAHRNQGIGARLVRAAEEWARERGLDRVVVRSRSTREAAHRFYLREGYEQTKTSAVFTKVLS